MHVNAGLMNLRLDDEPLEVDRFNSFSPGGTRVRTSHT